MKIRTCRFCYEDFQPRNVRALCCSRECSRLWFKVHRKPRTKEEVFIGRLAHDHSMVLEDYKDMLAEQALLCALCFLPLVGKVCIDHNHKCCPQGKSCGKCRRGIVHSACNLILGHSKDNPELLRMA